MTDDPFAEEPGCVDAEALLPVAPADERVARLRRRSGWDVLRSAGPWLLALLGVWWLQREGYSLHFPNGGVRVGLQVAGILTGIAFGGLMGARDDFPWLEWPPQGALWHRRTRLNGADVAHGGWRMLWLLPFLTVSAVLVVVMIVLAISNPQGLSATLYASTLLWHALLAAAAGFLVGRLLLRPGAEAITARGVHTSPVSFAPWSSLSHAIADPDELNVRLYLRRRPWVPRALLTFRTPDEVRRVAELVGEHLPCLRPEEEPLANRVRWAFVLAVLGGIVVLLTWVAVWLLVLAMMDPDAARNRLLYALISNMASVPEAGVMLALLAGVLYDVWLDEYRGITTKRIVSEDP